MQTRFDVGYLVTEFPTTAPYVLTDVSGIMEVVAMANRIIKALGAQEVILTYVKFFPNAPVVDVSLLHKIRIFIFTDDGFQPSNMPVVRKRAL